MKHAFAFLALPVVVVALSGCGFGAIRGIEHVRTPITPFMSPDQRASAGESNLIRIGRSTNFRVTGTGNCDAIRVKFGDGTDRLVTGADLSAGVNVAHTYANWGGPKTARAEIVSNCSGSAATSVNVLPHPARIGIGASTTAACAVAPIGSGMVRAGTVVNATPIMSPQTMIDFGPFSRGIEGSPEDALGPPFTFPFPGLKAHSLVFRIGTQVVQGGTGIPFTVLQTGALEICVNDDVLADNSGAWGIFLSIDESTVP